MNKEGQNPKTELTKLLEQGETSFLAAEQARQLRGFQALQRLLSLGNEKIHKILGITDLPQNLQSDSQFQEEFLSPSGTHQVDIMVPVPDHCPYPELRNGSHQVKGVRVQVNTVGNAKGLLTPTGGGVRVDYQTGEQADGGQWVLKSQQIDSVIIITRALAAAMGPKIHVLEFRKQALEFLSQSNLPPNIDSQTIMDTVRRIYPSGGAKGDFVIALPNRDLSSEQVIYLTGLALYHIGYELGKIGAIGPSVDRLAGDMNTGTHYPNGKAVLNKLAEGYCAAQRIQLPADTWTSELESYHMATVTGKTGPYGLEARADATGLGAWAAISITEKYLRLQPSDPNKYEPENQRVFVRGIGNAVCRTVEELIKNGYPIHAIADLGHLIIFCDGDMTQEEARQLLVASTQGKLPDGTEGSIADWARLKMRQHPERNIEVYFEYNSSPHLTQDEQRKEQVVKTDQTGEEYLKQYTPSIIVDAATHGTINAKNANIIKRGTRVYEIANGPVTPLGSISLTENGVLVVPGIITNGGGVYASMFEWLKNIFNLPADIFPTSKVEQFITDTIQENIKCLLSLMEEAGGNVTMEQAAYALAIARWITTKQDFDERTR